MKVAIGLNPNRVVANRANRGINKYARVSTGGKFKWVLDLEEATLFPSFQAALGAFGRRCQAVDKVTDDVLFHEVQEAARPVRPVTTRSVTRTLNGTEGTDRYAGTRGGY